MDNSKQEAIKRLTVDANTSILSAIKQMDEVKSKLLIVVKGDNFHSLFSIGDIQRAIVKQVSLETNIEEVLRVESKVTVATAQQSFDEIKQLMVKHRTEYMPVVNAEGKLVDIHFWKEIFDEESRVEQHLVNVPVVIMAGGKGTRLQPITNIIPKALVPIDTKPIVEIIIDKFVKHGVDQFYFTVNYKANLIEQYFNELEGRSYNVEYAREDKPLGTAGSLHLLKNQINTTFFVSNCDILIDANYNDILEYHNTHNCELTIVSALKHYAIPYGTIETGQDGLLTSIQEKPEITYLINSGMYILEPHLLEEVPEGEFFHITDLIEKIQQRGGKVGVFPVSEKSWMDIGEWKEYAKTQKEFLSLDF